LQDFHATNNGDLKEKKKRDNGKHISANKHWDEISGTTPCGSRKADLSPYHLNQSDDGVTGSRENKIRKGGVYL